MYKLELNEKEYEILVDMVIREKLKYSNLDRNHKSTLTSLNNIQWRLYELWEEKL